MKKGSNKSSHKYKSKKFVNGEWVYEYDAPKTAKKKKDNKRGNFKIENFYGEGVHKYFKTKKDLQNYKEKQKQGMAQNIGKKIKSTAGRISKGTSVKFVVGAVNIDGKIIASNGSTSKSPTHFDIQYKDSSGKVFVKKNVPRELVIRKEKAWSDPSKKELKKQRIIQDNKLLANTEIGEEVIEKAKDLVLANWEEFDNIAKKYYRIRQRNGWDASKFGFDEEDLRQECYIVVQKAAQSFLKLNKEGKGFKNYVKSFLKSNLAATLAASSGAGGHLKASAKDQLYLWFFKDTIDDYKQEKGRIPSDVELVDILENKRKALPNEEGYKTIRDYEWTIEKVKNKKRMTAKMTDLDRAIDASEGGDTLLSILSDEDVESIGHYKIDPVKEFEKKLIIEETKKAITRAITSPVDREILIRSYGLFVDENSPKSIREYAMGQTPGEISKVINRMEAKKGSLKRWTPTQVSQRTYEILSMLKRSTEFKETMGDFIKSEDRKPSDSEIIANWIVSYMIVDKVLDQLIPDDDGGTEEPKLAINTEIAIDTQGQKAIKKLKEGGHR